MKGEMHYKECEGLRIGVVAQELDVSLWSTALLLTGGQFSSSIIEWVRKSTFSIL